MYDFGVEKLKKKFLFKNNEQVFFDELMIRLLNSGLNFNNHNCELGWSDEDKKLSLLIELDSVNVYKYDGTVLYLLDIVKDDECDYEM